jgi:serine phosphatase RsbU (regulator of sigma subunit)
LDTFLTLNASVSGIPIVIHSGVKDDGIAVEAVRRGAQDFFHKGEMVSESLGRLLQYAIERFHRQQAEREIAWAGIVQSRLFPKQPPPIPGFDIAGRCDPANHVGGDYFDYFVVDNGDLIVVIGDVSGHGLGPSLVMAETRAALRTAAATTEDLALMMRRTNELLYGDEVSLFVTLFLGRINPNTRTLSYASAGHPGELLRQDGSFELLSTREPPLGIELDTRFAVRQTNLCSGDTMFLYTDGISERLSESREQFGTSRIRDLMATSARQTAAQSIDLLFDHANFFAGHGSGLDDMTAVVVKVV